MSRRIEAAGRAAAERAAARVAAAIGEAVPGVRASVSDDRVVIEGRGLRRDARLRWIAGLLK